MGRMTLGIQIVRRQSPQQTRHPNSWQLFNLLCFMVDIIGVVSYDAKGVISRSRNFAVTNFYEYLFRQPTYGLARLGGMQQAKRLKRAHIKSPDNADNHQ